MPERFLCDISVCEEDVYNSLAGLDASKAMGLDQIGPKILKTCAVALYPVITRLFQMCLNDCKIPSEWKLHKIVPIFKAKDKVQIANYRPISLLSCLSKVFEHVVYDKISGFLYEVIDPAQFGFLPNHSCVQQLLLMVEMILENWESGGGTDVIYLDIRKAFDTVPHRELLHKLRMAGISGKLWRLLKDYLTNRFHCVSVDGELSSFLPVRSGVPQGSILGPLMFLVYINDLPRALPLVGVLMFADDTKLLQKVVNECDRLRMQEELGNVMQWSSMWKLDFNELKCVVLSFGRSQAENYTMREEHLACSSSCKDLGVTVCTDLSWSQHHKNIIGKAYQILGLIRRTFGGSCNVETRKTLYLTLVRSKLTYCSQVWSAYSTAKLATS